MNNIKTNLFTCHDTFVLPLQENLYADFSKCLKSSTVNKQASLMKSTLMLRLLETRHGKTIVVDCERIVMDAPTTTLSTSGLKFQLDRTDFSDAVSWVAKALPSRPTQPVLAGILLSGYDSVLTLSGFDYEVSAQVRIPAHIHSEGTVLVSGRLLCDITKSLPAKKPVDLEVASQRLLLTCGKSRFSLPLLPVDDYPELPHIPDQTGTISSELFAEAISQVSLAAGRDDTLPMLTGIHMQLEKTTITLAATDRFRLAVRTIKWNSNYDLHTSILVPAKNLSDIAKANLSLEEISLSLGTENTAGTEGLLGISSSQKRTTTRLLDADFPKYDQLFPQQHDSIASLNVAELTEVIKRISLVAERGSQICLEFHHDYVHVCAGSDDFGRAEEDISACFYGEPLTIAFNPHYFLDGLVGITTKEVSIGFTDPKKPVVLRPCDGNLVLSQSGPYPALSSEYVYLLMPVRLPH